VTEAGGVDGVSENENERTPKGRDFACRSGGSDLYAVAVEALRVGGWFFFLSAA